jgi:hypothetical protein
MYLITHHHTCFERGHHRHHHRYAHLLSSGTFARVRHDVPQQLSSKLQSDLLLPIHLWLKAYKDAQVGGCVCFGGGGYRPGRWLLAAGMPLAAVA